MSVKYPQLNLGSSDDLQPGLNVDMCEPPPGATPANYLRADLCERWPFEDGSVEKILAYDVFEHLYKRPRILCNPFDANVEFEEGMRGQRAIIWCMNEAHRVLIPGGRLDLKVPCLPGKAPFVDPTHESVWTEDLRYYFDERWNNPQGERGRLGPAYGITALFRTVGGRSGVDWTPIAYAADDPERRKLMVLLEAVK